MGDVSTTIRSLAADGVLAFGDGYRTKRAELGASGFRILRVADVRDGTVHLDGPDFVRREFAPAIGPKASQVGDVLLTTKGTVGRVSIMPEHDEPVVYSPQLCYFRVLDPAVINPRFLAFWLRSPAFERQARPRADSTDMAAYLNLKDLGNIEIRLPDRERQGAIADVLGALDDKIAANDQFITAAEALGLSLAGRASSFIHVHELACHLTVSISPSEFASIVQHYSLPAFDTGATPETVGAETVKSSKFHFDGPAVLVSKLNPRIPRIWDVREVTGMSVASTEFVVLQPRDLGTTALWAAISQPTGMSQLASQVAGTSGSHQRVKPADVMELEVPDPRTLTVPELALLDSLGASVSHARVQTARLSATRDALLPLLMSGRLSVRDAEREFVGNR